MDKQLKPCPFCGFNALVEEHKFVSLPSSYGVACQNCSAQSYQFYNSEEEAIEAWNRRVGNDG